MVERVRDDAVDPGLAGDTQVRHRDQNFTRSPPLSDSISRASLGVATSRLMSSMMRRILETCSALLLASWPLPRNRLSSRPTRTLPPFSAAMVVNAIWCRPAASTPQRYCSPNSLSAIRRPEEHPSELQSLLRT